MQIKMYIFYIYISKIGTFKYGVAVKPVWQSSLSTVPRTETHIDYVLNACLSQNL